MPKCRGTCTLACGWGWSLALGNGILFTSSRKRCSLPEHLSYLVLFFFFASSFFHQHLRTSEGKEGFILSCSLMVIGILFTSTGKRCLLLDYTRYIFFSTFFYLHFRTSEGKVLYYSVVQSLMASFSLYLANNAYYQNILAFIFCFLFYLYFLPPALKNTRNFVFPFLFL